MTYAEWTALPLERRNALCAEAMGWMADWDMNTGQFCCWLDRAGNETNDGFWSPCTDRNDAAMMVEKVRNSGLSEQFAFDEAMAANTPNADDLLWGEVLLLPSDLIAWAAYEALRKEAS